MRMAPLVRAMLWAAAARECVCAQPPLTVAVYNYADVPKAVLARALNTAHWAYRGAGIETSWVVCDLHAHPDDPCGRMLPGGHRLDLMIMAHRQTHDRFEMGEPAGLALVDAELPIPRGYVFFAATNTAAKLDLRPVEMVLGCVLIHESAHLLGLGHEAQGVMRPHLNPVDIDAASMGRAFNDSEIKLLRAKLLHRTEKPTRLVAAR